MDEAGDDVCDVFLNEDDVAGWGGGVGGEVRVAREALEFASIKAEDAGGGDRRLNAADFKRLWDAAEGRGGQVRVVGCKEFPYCDGGRLEGKERLVEREYWLRVTGSHEFVVLHAHFEGRWNSKYWLRRKDVVLQANARHSVTAERPGVPVYHERCEDLQTWREKKGVPLQGLPERWSWKKDPKAHPGLAEILRRGEECTTFVRSLAARKQRRHALIFAVGTYRQGITDLPNAVRDGESLRESLEALGWAVTLLVDPTRAQARKAMRAFFDQCEEHDDAVLFAFFGHGVERLTTRQNYLVMSDTVISDEAGSEADYGRLLDGSCVNLQEEMVRLGLSRKEAGFPPTICILDCCRDDLEPPRIRSLSRSGELGGKAGPAGLRVTGGGLTGHEFRNSIFIRSTASGSTASDGIAGGNGPFMASFRTKVLQPGLELSALLKEVQREVGDQVVRPDGQLVQDFYFAGETAKAVAEKAPGNEAAAPAATGVVPWKDGGGGGEGEGGGEVEGAEVRTWLASIGGLTPAGRKAAWEMLDEEEVCTLRAVVKNIDHIKTLEAFQNLRIGTKSELEDAMEDLCASLDQSSLARASAVAAGQAAATSAPPPVDKKKNKRDSTRADRAGAAGIRVPVAAAVQTAQPASPEDAEGVIGEILAAAGGPGDVERVVACLQAHQGVKEVVEEGCGALQQLCSSNDENRMKVVRAGGIEAVVAGMERHLGEAGVQEQGCAALGSLNKVKVARAGGIEAVVHGMKTHLGEAGVQEQGCRALRNMCLKAENKVNVAGAGGIEAVIAGMGKHSGEARVQEQGCGALQNLSANVENKVKVAGAGGIEAIVAGMRGHLGEAGVQEHGCGALRNLCVNSENKVKVAEAGGIEAVVAGIGEHSGSAGVQQQGCGALAKLSENADNRVKVAGAGGIEAVLAGMWGHLGVAEVQEVGSLALANLCLNLENKAKVAEAGGIEAVVAVMGRHPRAEAVQRYGSRALETISRSRDEMAARVKRAELQMQR